MTTKEAADPRDRARVKPVCQACDGYGYVEVMRIGLTGHASPRYDKQRCDVCDGSGQEPS